MWGRGARQPGLLRVELGSGRDMEADEQMATTYAFKANVQVLKTNDRMMGALLDTKA